MKPIVFPSREGIELSMDHRSLRKVVYSHHLELGLSDLGNRVPCPIQSDPTKFQKQDCWATTDVNIREAIVKIFEFTTFNNPQILTLERFPRDCSTQLGTFFIDTNTGNVVYFRKGGKQNGKLWSLDKFKPTEINNMLQDPNINKITDISKFKYDDL